ncbi:MAG: DUF3783 domain-containing protein [Candidatus Thermoplasmatota archaeon]|nr:DUF3783 domain-containing protein [Candidatus Thermoplasmatota archaeon]
MDEIGIMLYGYDRETADAIRSRLSALTARDVLLFSASGREEDLIGDIIEDEEHDLWEAKEDPKVVMFLGFDGPLIHASMDGFPSFEGQNRPIFCTPTETNITWPLKDLLEDLLDEREYFRRRDEEAGKRSTDEKTK